ncbi:MAG: hypothetical protein MJ219_03550 [Mycoplasmoidaceae bacterium]|nr:hypothetical protein [Mycoplasmoidaceae bacterium]
MKNLLNKKFSIAISSAIACTTPLAFNSLTSCSQNSGIQFANFESYMNNKLMLHLENEYGVQFQ